VSGILAQSMREHARDAAFMRRKKVPGPRGARDQSESGCQSCRQPRVHLTNPGRSRAQGLLLVGNGHAGAAAVLRAAGLRAVAFFAAGFLAAGLRAVLFLAAVFFAAGLRAAVFFAAVFFAAGLRAAVFFAAVFFAAGLRAAVFFAAVFFAAGLRAAVFFAAVFFAAGLRAAVFFAAGFLAAFLAVDMDRTPYDGNRSGNPMRPPVATSVIGPFIGARSPVPGGTLPTLMNSVREADPARHPDGFGGDAREPIPKSAAHRARTLVFPIRVAGFRFALNSSPVCGCRQSQLRAPPVWYSMTRVSKKLRSFFRSIISLIHGKGFSSCGNRGSSPICCALRFAMNRRYDLNIGALRPSTPRGMVSSA